MSNFHCQYVAYANVIWQIKYVRENSNFALEYVRKKRLRRIRNIDNGTPEHTYDLIAIIYSISFIKRKKRKSAHASVLILFNMYIWSLYAWYFLNEYFKKTSLEQKDEPRCTRHKKRKFQVPIIRYVLLSRKLYLATVTAELQWLEHIRNFENMFETGVVQANEC